VASLARLALVTLAVTLCVTLAVLSVFICRPRSPRLEIPLPIGMMDSLAVTEGGAVPPRLILSGWVLSEDPVWIVSLYVDRRYVASAQLGQNRPEVNRAHPEFGAVRPGWLLELDTTVFPSGEHEVLIQARTSHGAVRDLGNIRLRFPGVDRP